MPKSMGRSLGTRLTVELSSPFFFFAVCWQKSSTVTCYIEYCYSAWNMSKLGVTNQILPSSLEFQACWIRQTLLFEGFSFLFHWVISRCCLGEQFLNTQSGSAGKKGHLHVFVNLQHEANCGTFKVSLFWPRKCLTILMFCFCNTATCIDGVASLPEGKSRGLCLVKLCANTG